LSGRHAPGTVTRLRQFRPADHKEKVMITIYGVPISVHARKPIVTAIAKSIPHKVEPVIPFDPPADWASLSPTGLIPAMRDGDFAVAESGAICLYLERKQPEPAIMPASDKDYSRVMFLDGYAGWMFRSLVQPLFFQKVINPFIFKGKTDEGVVANLLGEQRPKIFGYLESQMNGKFLVGTQLSLADIAIGSNLINYHYLGFDIDRAKYPRLRAYAEGIVALEPMRKALAGEAATAEQMGLDRQFLS
jgi:glutathione S-transferase